MEIRIPLACVAIGHKPNRGRAWFDNLNWRSNCIYCQTPLIKTFNGWRTFTPNDYDLCRCSKDEAILLTRADAVVLDGRSAKPI